MVLTIASFVFFTALVAVLTWLLTRGDKHDTKDGYFLGGRSLTGGYIAGSLMLTNLSTEQLVGLNGSAFGNGLCVMAWEVLAGASLVLMALYFLPRYLKSGVATVPELLEKRYDNATRSITSIIFIVAYAGILLPLILYTGAKGMVDILDLPGMFGVSYMKALVTTVWTIGLIGSVYAIVGGLRTVAVSDTLNGFGLLTGGLLIAYLGLKAVNPDGVSAALKTMYEASPEKFNSIGGPKQDVPFTTLFTGVLLLNMFYWCTNQQIIQRTFGASNLKEGQKGVLFAGLLKLLAPLILVLPGLVAYHSYGRVDVDGKKVPVKDITSADDAVTLYGTTEKDGVTSEVVIRGLDALKTLDVANLESAKAFENQTITFENSNVRVTAAVGPNVLVIDGVDANQYIVDRTPEELNNLIAPRLKDSSYGHLVQRVLPGPLQGFFAAVVLGAVLSSFNSALNSTATLFSLGVYGTMLRPTASESEVIRSGHVFGWIIAIAAMLVAPLLAGQDSIFGYLQKMNGLYFIPIFSVVVMGLVNKRVPSWSANLALIVGFAAIATGYFVPQVDALISKSIHGFHFLGIVFAALVLLMLVASVASPRKEAWVQEDAKAVDLTPWKFAVPMGALLVIIALSIYGSLADFSVLAG